MDSLFDMCELSAQRNFNVWEWTPISSNDSLEWYLLPEKNNYIMNKDLCFPGFMFWYPQWLNWITYSELNHINWSDLWYITPSDDD